MDLKEFKSTVFSGKMPAGLTEALQAMWHDAAGNWDRAHDIAQDIHSAEGSWIHAYLHRKEGDTGNASYWYHRANQPACKTALEEEWEQIATALLQKSHPDVRVL
jgi:hypothetical protein